MQNSGKTGPVTIYYLLVYSDASLKAVVIKTLVAATSVVKGRILGYEATLITLKNSKPRVVHALNLRP